MRIFRKYIWICAAFFFIVVGCTNQQTESITLSYMGLRFNIATGVTAMGLVENNNEKLILRYGQILSKNYVSFQKLADKFDCDPGYLIEQALGNGDITACNAYAGEFKNTYSSNSDIRFESHNAVKVFYSVNSAQVDAFIILNKDRVIHIDSDFLNRDQLSGIIMTSLRNPY